MSPERSLSLPFLLTHIEHSWAHQEEKDKTKSDMRQPSLFKERREPNSRSTHYESWISFGTSTPFAFGPKLGVCVCVVPLRVCSNSFSWLVRPFWSTALSWYATRTRQASLAKLAVHHTATRSRHPINNQLLVYWTAPGECPFPNVFLQ